MNKILAAIVVAAFVAAMVGMALIFAPSIHDPLTPEQHYVQDVRAVFPESGDLSDREIIRVGVLMCQEADVSPTIQEAIKEVWTDNGFTTREMKLVEVAAEKYLCDQ